MILLISILASLAIGIMAGFKYRDLKDSIIKLSRELRDKMDKKVEVVESKSTLLDPDDVEHRAKQEHDALMRKLNQK